MHQSLLLFMPKSALSLKGKVFFLNLFLIIKMCEAAQVRSKKKKSGEDKEKKEGDVYM